MRAAWIAAVMVLGVSAARADDPLTSLQEGRRAAEQLEKQAKEGGDREAYDRCGEAYLALEEPTRAAGGDVDEVLYNAAVCFQEAGSIGRALVLLDRVMAEFPRRRVAGFALARSGMLRHTAGDFAGAAERFERYAATYAGEHDAYDALRDAIVLRSALGDLKATRRTVQRFIKTFGAKKPGEAAEAALFLARQVEEHGTPEDAIGAYQDWLRHYGGRGDVLLRARALRALGELELGRSCAVKLTDGLCLRRVTSPPKAGRCKPSAVAMVAVARKDAALRTGLAAMLQAAKSAESSRDDSGGAGWIHGQAALAQALPATEAALASLPPPLLLDARGEWTRASRDRTAAWLAQQAAQHARADAGLDAALRSRNLRIAALALGRSAWRLVLAADQLEAAVVPALPPGASPAGLDAYCGAMVHRADELRILALTAARRCLELPDLADELALCARVEDQLSGTRARELTPPLTWSTRIRDLEP